VNIGLDRHSAIVAWHRRVLSTLARKWCTFEQLVTPPTCEYRQTDTCLLICGTVTHVRRRAGCLLRRERYTVCRTV
jgi:hypothetical protein